MLMKKVTIPGMAILLKLAKMEFLLLVLGKKKW